MFESLNGILSDISWSTSMCNFQNTTSIYCLLHALSLVFHFFVQQCWKKEEKDAESHISCKHQKKRNQDHDVEIIIYTSNIKIYFNHEAIKPNVI